MFPPITHVSFLFCILYPLIKFYINDKNQDILNDLSLKVNRQVMQIRLQDKFYDYVDICKIDTIVPIFRSAF